MAKKLEQLTDEQIARFPEFIKRWTDIGLCTLPADRPNAERGVRLAYECAGLTPPKLIVWCGSPLSQGLTRAIVFGLKDAEVKIGASVWASVLASVTASVWDSVTASVTASVWDSVGDSVTASVGASVRASVWASVWDSVGDSVTASVGASVRASVWASVWDSVGASVGASVRASVWDSVGDSVYGQQEAGWLSFYEYFRIAAGMDSHTQKLTGLFQVAQSAGWFLPHQNVCWISERHNVLNRNDEGRLHCENGPAVQYPDGWSIYAIGGVLVDQQTIMRPETQTVEQLDSEQNAEKRRVRIERFGWTRYLKESNAEVLDFRDNDIEATKESLMRTAKGERMLVCHCPSTSRIYAMPVTEEVENCEQAQNFLWSGNRYAEGKKKIRVIGRT